MINLPGIGETDTVGRLIDALRNDSTIAVNAHSFTVNSNVYSSFRKIFDCFLSEFIDKELRCFKNGISDRLKFYSPLNKAIKKFYSKIIVREFVLLDEFNRELSPLGGVKFLEPSMYKGLWDIHILDSGFILLKILNSQKLNLTDFSFPDTVESADNKNEVVFFTDSMQKKTIRFSNNAIDVYPLSDKMKKIFLAVVTAEKIKYLQACIKELDRPRANGAMSLVLDFVKSLEQKESTLTHLDEIAEKDFVPIKARKKDTAVYDELKDIFRTEPLFNMAIKTLEEVLEDYTVTCVKKKLRPTGIVKTWYQSLFLNKWLKYTNIRTEVVAECLNKYFKNKFPNNIVSEKTLRTWELDSLEEKYRSYFVAKFKTPSSAG